MLDIAQGVAIASCNAQTALVNAGTTETAGYFTVYSGVKPATAATALSGNTALVTMAMSADAFADATYNAADQSADALANAVADTPAIADGLATFYRQFDRDGNVVWQGTVTEPNAGGDMELSSVNVIDGVSVVCQSYIFRVPM